MNQGLSKNSVRRDFRQTAKRAIKVCTNSQNSISAHFSQVGKMVKIGLGVERHIPDHDYRLTRYACYLIVQNTDSWSLDDE